MKLTFSWAVVRTAIVLHLKILRLTASATLRWRISGKWKTNPFGSSFEWFVFQERFTAFSTKHLHANLLCKCWQGSPKTSSVKLDCSPNSGEKFFPNDVKRYQNRSVVQFVKWTIKHVVLPINSTTHLIPNEFNSFEYRCYQGLPLSWARVENLSSSLNFTLICWCRRTNAFNYLIRSEWRVMPHLNQFRVAVIRS